MTAETDMLAMLRQTSPWTVIAKQLAAFQELHSIRPERIVVCIACKPAAVKELMLICGMPPEAAVLEPVWIEGIPVTFSSKLGDNYVFCVNTRHAKELTL